MAFDWTQTLPQVRRLTAAAPAALAAFGVAMAASSMPRPEIDQRAEAVARATGGDLGARGLAAMTGRLDPAQLALAIRHDPNQPRAGLYGLTPGWESVTLAGKPTLVPGASGMAAQRLNARVPDVTGALRPALPFSLAGASPEDRRRALRCLTQAVYYEAALESTEGQEGVAQVVLNRVRDANYANTVCGVVFEGAERITGCQFSFTCDGSLGQAPVAWAWTRAQSVAQRALAGHVAKRVGTATHYHADYVHPWWSPTLTRLTKIGAHIFYRWKGQAGESSSFLRTYRGKEPRIDEARFSRPRLQVASALEVTPEEAALALAAAAAGGTSAMRTVTIDGQTRVVGVTSLGGRRQPSSEDIAAINQRLATFEAPAAPAAPSAAPSPAGVVPMAVEEVGRPTP